MVIIEKLSPNHGYLTAVHLDRAELVHSAWIDSVGGREGCGGDGDGKGQTRGLSQVAR